MSVAEELLIPKVRQFDSEIDATANYFYAFLFTPNQVSTIEAFYSDDGGRKRGIKPVNSLQRQFVRLVMLAGSATKKEVGAYPKVITVSRKAGNDVHVAEYKTEDGIPSIYAEWIAS